MNIYVALIMAAVLSFLIAFLLGFVLIPWLRKLKFGQTILDIGPAWHKSKQGTPVMGGIMFIVSTILSTICVLVTDHFLGGNLFGSEHILPDTLKVKLVAGVILAIGRIVGESAALLFTAGSGYLLPNSAKGYFTKILESGGTLTIELYLSMSKAKYDVAFGIALVLLVVVFCINVLTKVLIRNRIKGE